MRNVLVALFTIFFSSALIAAELQELEQLMQVREELYGDFEQVKYVKAMDTELNSSGSFAFHRNQSILWQTSWPIENTIELSRDTMVNRQNGQELARLDTQTNPVVTVFSDIFFGVMTSDWSQLERYFSITLEPQDRGWKVHLVPIDVNVRKIISGVDLEGNSYLKRVLFYEETGDRTEIQFSNFKP